MDTNTFTVSNQLDGSILSTARTNGNPVQSIDDLKPNTVVKAGGMEMTLQSAVNAGLLRKTANGYEEVNQGNFNSASEEVEESIPTEVSFNKELSHPQIEASLENIAQTVGGYQQLDSIALSAVAGISAGDIDAAAKRLATSTGTEHETAKEFIDQTYQMYRSKAESYITSKHGVDGDAVINWISSNLPQHERNSILHQIYLDSLKLRSCYSQVHSSN